MNNIDYIKFVVSKVESGFLESSNSREYVKVITVLNSLKMADNILKELYILSGIKKLRRLTSYFIFMIKKVEAGSITLDNFMENYLTDRNYIDLYFQTYYDLEQITPEEFIHEEIDTKFIIEESEEREESPVYLLAESTFRVAELDNELVTEEFRDSTISENYESPGDGYMKLADGFVDNGFIEPETSEVFFDEGNEDVFNLPNIGSNKNSETKPESVDGTGVLSDETFFTGKDETAEQVITEPVTEEPVAVNSAITEPEQEEPAVADSTITELISEEPALEDSVITESATDISVSEDSVFTEPVMEPVITEPATEEPVSEEPKSLFSNAVDSQGDNNENLADFFEKLDNEEISVEPAEDNTVFIETPIINTEEQFSAEEENEFVESENESIESKVLQDLIPVMPDENDFVTDPEDVRLESDREVEEKLHEIEQETSEEILNAEFLKYEKSLYEKNHLISGLLDDLTLISESKEPDTEMRDAILLEIFPLVSNLKEESEKLSFEIISGIYESLMFCLDIKFKDIVATKENIEIFKSSLAGVENLVRGDELKGFDKTIKNLESIQGELNKLLADREDFEKKKYDFGEEESNLIKEFKDSSEYDAYIILREKITELEDTFQVIAGMKDKTYPFESLRKLSVTFALFREIVNIARVLEMNKVAHLAEAGYVFVKFVQNYRIDPFKDEVTEVFKYLIYSFKLIYLDKPVKDFDTFLSFLNDPVKIFYQKTKTDE
ncbi:MAG: hypothetical protein WCK13_06755 [Ignavibacteriota bacterium]|nr:hypothetical protein [Ignavibacteriota bacterium]